MQYNNKTPVFMNGRADNVNECEELFLTNSTGKPLTPSPVSERNTVGMWESHFILRFLETFQCLQVCAVC